MRRTAARTLAALAIVPVGAAVAAPAAAARPGVSVQFTQLPARFVAGAAAQTVTVVVSKGNGACEKVRWSMLLRVRGARLDQLRVDRIEGNASFATQVQTDGEVARVTDVQVDGGVLCRDRTVTAQYRVAFNGDVGDAQVRLEPQAFSADNQFLQAAVANREIVGAQGGAAPSPSSDGEVTPSESPSDDAAGTAGTDDPGADVTDEPTDSPSEEAIAGSGGGTGAQTVNARPASQVSRIPVLGFVSGAVLLFLGFGLLMAMRRRLKRAPIGTGFGARWSGRNRRRDAEPWSELG